MTQVKGKREGTPSKAKLYALCAEHAKEAIECLMEVIRHGDNDAARMGAAKVILSKCIPDLKSTEIEGEGAKALAGLVKLYADRNSS